MQKVCCFLDKFTQLVRILLDRRSWRSQQISTLVWLSPHHMRHSSTTPRLQYVLFPNIYILGPRCHQPLHPASRWPGLPSTQSIPAPHFTGGLDTMVQCPQRKCVLFPNIYQGNLSLHAVAAHPRPSLALDTRKNLTTNGKQQYRIFVQERDLWKLNLCTYHQDASNILYVLLIRGNHQLSLSADLLMFDNIMYITCL